MINAEGLSDGELRLMIKNIEGPKTIVNIQTRNSILGVSLSKREQELLIRALEYFNE